MNDRSNNAQLIVGIIIFEFLLDREKENCEQSRCGTPILNTP